MRRSLYLLFALFICLAPASASIQGTLILAPASYRVAVVDRFYPPEGGFQSDSDRSLHRTLYGMFDIDDDQVKEPYYHGDLVSMIASDPRFSLIHYPIRDGVPPIDEIQRNLKKLLVRQASQPVTALVLSWESSTLISAFEKPLRREHASRYKAELARWGETSPVWQSTREIIDTLEALVASGVAVYTIAGNGGRGMVNTFSFAEGVITVGAAERELSHFVSDNAFVDTYAPAAYKIRRVDDAAGKPVGYDVDGDRCPDIPLNRLTAATASDEYPGSYWKLIKGSSFAAPAAMKTALLAGLAPGCAIKVM
ncbi:S8/S53 family peptidase [Marinobacterium jannaschii]|uniref:hypothetical protein n=1 Tax=Marinobacterium jannaschii TaxID=64970 RepID=UPI000AB3C6F0|nr:hypothetical protein [Marinobacterium jannaschii]